LGKKKKGSQKGSNTPARSVPWVGGMFVGRGRLQESGGKARCQPRYSLRDIVAGHVETEREKVLQTKCPAGQGRGKP